jgi:hypothetical protein
MILWPATAALLACAQNAEPPRLAEKTISIPAPEALPATSSLTAIWANNGEDKVTRNELRATKDPTKVGNSIWDGKKILLFGARNEIVNFNLILEAGKAAADAVSINFRSLAGPGGAEISSPAPDRAAIFNWTKRNIELFFVRYLQIRGLSYFGYNSGASGFDERIVPKGLQRPWSGNGYTKAQGGWTDRPNHDAFYPEIAVPLELHPSFQVARGANQSIWVDIYIPSDSPAGRYTGKLTVLEGKSVIRDVPVELTVRNFSLPDLPSSKTMLFFALPDVARRFTGKQYQDPLSKEFAMAERASITALQIAHRHKISLIGDWGPLDVDEPSPTLADALTGKLFTAKHGYSGPGVNTGNNVYAVLPYGGFRSVWKSPGETEVSRADVWVHSNNWESWFKSHAPTVDRFLYLCDECYGSGGNNGNNPGPREVDQWAAWMKENPKIGKNLKSFVTNYLDTAAEKEPNVDYVASSSLAPFGKTTDSGSLILGKLAAVGKTADSSAIMAEAFATIRSRKGSKIMFYNPSRPGSGSFMTEDDGVALREVAWAQYKKNIDRVFYWSSTYYLDGQNQGNAENNVFEDAATFAVHPFERDPLKGEWSYVHTNGDGVLFYPGTDVIYPKESYGVPGMFASLRLKYWRRGIQDIDYVTLAAAINPAETQKIVDRMVPRSFWDYKDLGGWMVDDISYSINPDVWEAARKQLADIIEKGRGAQ